MKTKSQWNFGELFPTEAPRRVWTVGEITVTIRRLLEQQVGEVWVAGEITNLRAQASGHVYFTLKDPAAQLSCVLFRGEVEFVLNEMDLLRLIGTAKPPPPRRISMSGSITRTAMNTAAPAKSSSGTTSSIPAPALSSFRPLSPIPMKS